MNTRITFFLALAVFTVAGSQLHARPPHKKALVKYFGTFLSKKLNTCQTCHLPDRSGQEGKPHNAFGTRLYALKKSLRKDKKPYDIPARIQACADEDSDGDGVTNLIELLTGHFPGDAKDKPDTAAVGKSKATLIAFRAFLAEYRWTPFEQVQRPDVPMPKNRAWVRNPIDAFIAVKHEKHKLEPRPTARKHLLLRRVYLDLIGLPPTPSEVHAFQSDHSPVAYERVVDKLLTDARYGERWGRHWMDVWRYSDWAGYRAQVRDSKPHIWRWRDWIVDALNADKGYDRMIQEMLAGDELEPENPKVLRATGFLVRNWYKFNRNVWLDRIVEHTAKGMLGITLNCARCHDHKYDPITQDEYYQFRAIFEPHQVRTDRVPGVSDIKKDGLVRVYDADANAKTYLFIGGNEKRPDKERALSPTVLSALNWDNWKVTPVKIPELGRMPEKLAFVKQFLLTQKLATIKQRQQALAKVKKNPKAKMQFDIAALDVQYAIAEYDAFQSLLKTEELEDAGNTGKEWQDAARHTVKFQRKLAVLQAERALLRTQDDWRKMKIQPKSAAQDQIIKARLKLEAAKLTYNSPPDTNYTKRNLKSYPATSTGRRLALAKWITNPKNPLTARVAINHIWLRHFGQSLVPTVFDFGNNGRPPTHPALLDWLASELMANKWSMKHIHRLIVTSATYRMSSTYDEANFKIDPDNRYLWRMKSKRMEAEVVRDSVLYVAGNLHPTMGGAELAQNLGMTTYRRSLYYRHAPEKMMTFLTQFDSANVVECYKRSETVVPQQALAMANSKLVMGQARLLARWLVQKLGKDAMNSDFIRAGFERILCRPPTTAELKLCEKFLLKQSAMFRSGKKLTPFNGGVNATVPPSGDPLLRTRENLIHVLLNHNEFVTIR